MYTRSAASCLKHQRLAEVAEGGVDEVAVFVLAGAGEAFYYVAEEFRAFGDVLVFELETEERNADDVRTNIGGVNVRE